MKIFIIGKCLKNRMFLFRNLVRISTPSQTWLFSTVLNVSDTKLMLSRSTIRRRLLDMIWVNWKFSIPKNLKEWLFLSAFPLPTDSPKKSKCKNMFKNAKRSIIKFLRGRGLDLLGQSSKSQMPNQLRPTSVIWSPIWWERNLIRMLQF